MTDKTYKVFGEELIITDEYRADALEILRSWNTLHDYLVRTRPSEYDLMKLIVIEKETKSRSQIISRLHSSLISTKRKDQRKELGLDNA